MGEEERRFLESKSACQLRSKHIMRDYFGIDLFKRDKSYIIPFPKDIQDKIDEILPTLKMEIDRIKREKAKLN